MDNVLKGIIIAAGVLLTIILVGIGFYIARETKSTSTEGINQLSNLKEDGYHVELSMYDGRCISGSEVMQMIKDYKSKPVFMCVKTKSCASLEGVFYNYDYIDDVLIEAGTYMDNMASFEDRINKNGKFMCLIKRNKLKVIVGISYIQK